ncbi:Cerato-platanin [Flagelloscypha sp. PMI_526]|nr:Cerato-platanin [Flagelloscypha sp. PMI_526]
MKFLVVSALLSFAAATRVSWDATYDKASTSLDVVACSNGDNGVETKYGWKKLGDVSTFPLIGGADVISGWNDVDCGTCWKLAYNNRSITVLAIDHCQTGFNIGKTAMNQLTNNRAEEVGVVQATATKQALSACGL